MLCTALLSNVFILLIRARFLCSPTSHQDSKSVQQCSFVTRLGTVPHQTPHPPFREASESIEWVSCRCFLAWEGCEVYSSHAQNINSCVYGQVCGVSTHGRWKPQKAGWVDESFGRWLQKASGLQGHSTRNRQLWTVRQNVESTAGIK